MCGKGNPFKMEQNIKNIKSLEFINTLYKIISENIEGKEEKENDTK